MEADASGGGGGTVVLELFDFPAAAACIDSAAVTAPDGAITLTLSYTAGVEACSSPSQPIPAKFFVVGGNLSYEFEAVVPDHPISNVSLWPSFAPATLGGGPPLECFPDGHFSNCPGTSSGSGLLTPGPYAIYVRAFEGTSSFTLTLTP